MEKTPTTVKVIYPFRKNESKLKELSKKYNLKIFPRHNSVIFEGCYYDYLDINSVLIGGVAG